MGLANWRVALQVTFPLARRGIAAGLTIGCARALGEYGATLMVGGDINGGSVSGLQFFLRPTWRRYATPMKGIYLCSSSTPPGGAVHGMCGYWAAQCALKHFC